MHPSPGHRRDSVERLLGLLCIVLCDEAPGFADEDGLSDFPACPICTLKSLLTVASLISLGLCEIQQHAGRGSSKLVCQRLVLPADQWVDLAQEREKLPHQLDCLVGSGLMGLLGRLGVVVISHAPSRRKKHDGAVQPAGLFRRMGLGEITAAPSRSDA